MESKFKRKTYWLDFGAWNLNKKFQEHKQSQLSRYGIFLSPEDNEKIKQEDLNFIKENNGK